MRLLVDALTKLGPAPTRAGIKRVLDSTVLDVGLGPALRFVAGNHYASITARAYQDITQSDDRGTFANWRYTNVFLEDREVGKDVSG
jgi:hypothetical protein